MAGAFNPATQGKPMPIFRKQTPTGETYTPNPESDEEYTEEVTLPSELTHSREHRHAVMKSHGLLPRGGRRAR